jgi:bifunctional DNA-binding transcriptional regulator/antitoxin component of YhaV-PrlF toxin-antitoxin module
MADEDEPESITFSKKVDGEGRMVVPKEHRQALGMDGRDAVVLFEAQIEKFLDEDEGGDT